MTNKVLTRSTTRERTLFYMHIWYLSDAQAFKEWAGIDLKGSLFIGEGKSKKVTAWYDNELVDAFTHEVKQRASNDPEYLSLLWQKYHTWTPILEAFLTQEKKIVTIDDLKDFYHAFIAWWSPMSALLEFPDFDDAPEDLVKQVTLEREKTETWPDLGEALYLEFIKRTMPELEDIYSVITPDELFSLGTQTIDEKQRAEIEERLGGYVFFDGSLYRKSDLEQVLHDHHYTLEKEVSQTTGEIKGMPASRGMARGQVRILSYRHEIPELEEGEILVTPMTTPDFLPAVKKAAAIVTDEGGITCHAAIVARELRKPCIIGTKIATQVLKNGDMVEVNATKGILRIL